MKTKLEEITPQDKKIIAIGVAAVLLSLLADSGLVDGLCAVVLAWAGLVLLRQFAIHRKHAQDRTRSEDDSDEEDEPENTEEPVAAHA